MAKLHRPTKLIRISSEAAIGGAKQRFWRTRVGIYAAGLAVVLGVFALVVFRRTDVELNLSRQVGAPWVARPDGTVLNAMQLRIANKGDHARSFAVEAVSPAELELVTPVPQFSVAAGAVDHVPVFLVLPVASARKQTVTLRVRDDDAFVEDIETQFVGPGAP